jgi:tetrahydromethanopterin S-methyltransferase subunit A
LQAKLNDSFFLFIYFSRMLSSEQRDEVSFDLHNMQREMVRTYASCQAADQEIMRSLRQAVHQDPVLRDDPVAIQCVDTIEEQTNQLQTLPSTPESLLERSIMMDSMRSHLSLLEERTEHVNPNGPLSKVLKLFKKALITMAHMLSSVIKTLGYQFNF